MPYKLPKELTSSYISFSVGDSSKSKLLLLRGAADSPGPFVKEHPCYLTSYKLDLFAQLSLFPSEFRHIFKSFQSLICLLYKR